MWQSVWDLYRVTIAAATRTPVKGLKLGISLTFKIIINSTDNTVVISNVVDVQWQKLGVTRNAQSNVFWNSTNKLFLTFVWRSWYRASLMYSFKYNQQDVTLYNIIYYCQCSTCFGRFLRPSSGAQKLYTHTASGICQACLLLPLAVAASNLGIYLILCVQFLSSWWWAEKPPATCRALTVVKNIV